MQGHLEIPEISSKKRGKRNILLTEITAHYIQKLIHSLVGVLDVGMYGMVRVVQCRILRYQAAGKPS